MSKNYFLPENEVHWNDVRSYIDKQPDADYVHASESAMDAFRDMKYGVRIHWGLYSEWKLSEESWPYLKMSYEERQKYQELYKTFNPRDFNAENWMRFFNKAGFKCFAFTSKHHEGFSMFDTKTRVKKRMNWTHSESPQLEDCDLAFSVMDTPFKRDIVQELCQAASKYDIKVDLYFSHPDWYDADFRPYCFHPATVPNSNELLTERELPGFKNRFNTMEPFMLHSITDEEKSRMIARHRQQLLELVTQYKVDMLCLDMWLGKDVWPEVKETIKHIRNLKPDIMIRARGIGNYGDYYTPEGFVPGSPENTDLPWMVIYPLGSSFSYESESEKHKGSAWVIKNLVDAVAKGGNFMVGIGPDRNGQWHPTAIQQLEQVGEWLNVNGEAIYGTVPVSGHYKEGESIYFTSSKDAKNNHIICMDWPGHTLNVTSLKPKAGSNIRLLGCKDSLKWEYSPTNGISIFIPQSLQEESNRPCKMAYVFAITPPL